MISTDPIQPFILNQWVLLALICIVILYSVLSRRISKLPRIPLNLFLVYLLLRFIISLFGAHLPVNTIKWTKAVSLIVLYCFFARIVFALTVETWFSIKKYSAFPKITRDFILFFCYAIIVFVVLRGHGVNPVGLITTSAVLTAVIGLAAQNTLGNIFAGLALQIERPYSIGEWIKYGDQDGLVVGIGWKSTRLKTFDDEIVYVPNLDIAKTVLKNFSKPTRRHFMKISIGVDYDSAPNHVRSVLLSVLQEDKRVLQDPSPQVRLIDYGDFAITYQVRFAYEDYGTQPELRASIMNMFWYSLKRNGIKIPFPIRDTRLIHVERKFDTARLDDERKAARAELNSIPILAPLPSPARDAIIKDMHIARYGGGETIVRQGEAGDSMYIVHSGLCEVFVQKGGDTPFLVATLAPPSFFGEMSLLTGEPRSATVRAKQDSVLFKIDKELFKSVLVADPSISESLAQVLVERQAKTAQTIDAQLGNIRVQTSSMLRKIKSFFSV